MYVWIGILLLIPIISIHGKQASTMTNDMEPLHEGNFALPTSQQPGPLVSFGQNIIDNYQMQINLQPLFTRMVQGSELSTELFFLYGLNNNASLLLSIPFALDYKNSSGHSQGLSDLAIQGEYAFFNSSDKTVSKQATIVGELTFPSGSASKSPATGSGSYNVFVGTTYNQMFVNWFWFVSPGITWFIPNHHQRLGSQYVYQGGLGHILNSQSNQFIISSLLEVDGTYSEKNQLQGQLDPNSGGNVINITPSLWYSNKQLIIQCGLSWPILQRLNGTQPKTNYTALATLTWSIN